jgi:hypothetical protein
VVPPAPRPTSHHSGVETMPSVCRVVVAILLAGVFGWSCGGAGGVDGDDGGGARFVGVWQYQAGSSSFVNCYFSSRSVDLTRTGFQIADEGGILVRTNPDGCRFTVVPSTATHADGVAGEECTVQSTDILGNPMTTHYQLKSLVMELRPADAGQMVEVFALAAANTTTLGTSNCEISGSNTLDRAP